jgi:hypothetical protein
MKKLLLAVLALLLATGVSFAGGVRRTIIPLTTISNATTGVNVTSGAVEILGMERPTFIVKYDETDAGTSVNGSIALTCSYDGLTNWTALNFYDLAGGSTNQTSELLATDSVYLMWLGDQISVPYVNMTITSANVNSTNTANVSAYLIGNR